MKKIIEVEAIQAALEKSVWQKISISKALSMEMIERYGDKLDWEDISQNSYILWTIQDLWKQADKLDWRLFSIHSDSSLMSKDYLNEFRDYWDWENLSSRFEFVNNWELIEEFADLIDWCIMINNWSIGNPIAFFKRFEKYILEEDFIESRLFSSMADESVNSLMFELINGEGSEEREK